MQPIFSPYDILCQILVESAKDHTSFDRLLLEHKLAYGLKQIVMKLVSLHQSYRFSELVSYQVASSFQRIKTCIVIAVFF